MRKYRILPVLAAMLVFSAIQMQAAGVEAEVGDVFSLEEASGLNTEGFGDLSSQFDSERFSAGFGSGSSDGSSFSMPEMEMPQLERPALEGFDTDINLDSYLPSISSGSLTMPDLSSLGEDAALSVKSNASSKMKDLLGEDFSFGDGKSFDMENIGKEFDQLAKNMDLKKFSSFQSLLSGSNADGKSFSLDDLFPQGADKKDEFEKMKESFLSSGSSFSGSFPEGSGFSIPEDFSSQGTDFKEMFSQKTDDLSNMFPETEGGFSLPEGSGFSLPEDPSLEGTDFKEMYSQKTGDLSSSFSLPKNTSSNMEGFSLETSGNGSSFADQYESMKKQFEKDNSGKMDTSLPEGTSSEEMAKQYQKMQRELNSASSSPIKPEGFGKNPFSKEPSFDDVELSPNSFQEGFGTSGSTSIDLVDAYSDPDESKNSLSKSLSGASFSTGEEYSKLQKGMEAKGFGTQKELEMPQTGKSLPGNSASSVFENSFGTPSGGVKEQSMPTDFNPESTVNQKNAENRSAAQGFAGSSGVEQAYQNNVSSAQSGNAASEQEKNSARSNFEKSVGK